MQLFIGNIFEQGQDQPDSEVCDDLWQRYLFVILTVTNLQYVY